MAPEDRAKVIAANRSLRTIKNELENLLESGLIEEEKFYSILDNLPSESSIGRGINSRPATASPAPNSLIPIVPTNAMAHMNVTDAPTKQIPSPSSNLPPRGQQEEIGRAVALYRYAEPGDCNFEVGDEISVLQYTNNEWWLGRNMRTGAHGVFPATYVQRQGPPAHSAVSEKSGAYNGYVPQQPQYATPAPTNPYNSSIPPMAVSEQPMAQQGGGENKAAGMGKKIGKKLGNAAIFGAGATLGGDLIHSIGL